MLTGFASARFLASLALLPALGGCVAAAALAVPAMTAIGAATREKSPAVRPAPAPEPTAPTVVADEAADVSIELLPVTELPAPHSAPDAASDPWRDLMVFALSRTEERIASAILTQEAKLDLLPGRDRCEQLQRAVVIDLDPGPQAFEPGAPFRAQQGLADKLDVLRRANILVMWISKQDPNRVGEIADALLRSGLDPSGRDPILLTLGDGDRKQTLREQAAQSACIVAIAGDERQDFDELFGYLRDPTRASNFDPLIGSGWFLVPQPLAVASD